MQEFMLIQLRKLPAKVLIIILIALINVPLFAKTNKVTTNHFSAKELLVISKTHAIVKYFYPSKRNSKVNWDKLLYDLIKNHETDSLDNTLDYLNEYYGKYGVRIYKDSLIDNSALVKGKWEHEGYGYGTNSFLKNKFIRWLYNVFGPYKSKYKRSERSLVQSFKVKNEKYFLVFLEHKKAKKLPVFLESEDWFNYPYASVTNMISIYGTIQLFYSNKLDEVEFDNAFLKLIDKAYSDLDEKDALVTLKFLLEKLNDGHATVFATKAKYSYTIPIQVNLIEDSLFITGISTSIQDDLNLNLHDKILKIDKENYNEVINKKLLETASGNRLFKINDACYNLFNGVKNTEVELEIEKENGKLQTITCTRDSLNFYFLKNEVNNVLSNNILYFDLSKNLSAKEIKKAILNDNKAIIFDMREYPNVSNYFLAYLAHDTILESPKWLVPNIVSFPNRVFEFDTSSWIMKAQGHDRKKRVVFLANENTISGGETYLSIVKYYNLATIIGDTTAGANGNIINIRLNGGFNVYLTGMKVLNQDYAAFHGHGIPPDIVVKPTIKGIKENRDELLERAVEFINQQE